MGNTHKDFKRYVFVVSDATGKTCQKVVEAALKQFETTKVVRRTYYNVRTFPQIEMIINKATTVNGIVIYTMVCPECRRKITELGRRNGVPTVDIMGPLLTRFSDLLEISPMAKPGLDRQLDDEYFKRIEAVDYTIKHDDGLRLNTLKLAEIVLLGVSRTTKTPVSIYLSYRGWKVANIPVIQDHDLPKELLLVNSKKVVALTIKPIRLQLIRLERQRYLQSSDLGNYTELEQVKKELTYGLRLFQKYKYPVLDITYKSIEETATEVMRIIYGQTGKIKGRNIL
jgi:regulator of PEP synthase PpsR (kinase-PPPase family)